MNTVQQKFDRLITEVSVFFKNQQEVYSDVIYTDYNFDELVLTPIEIKNQQLIKFSEQIKNCQNCKLSEGRHNVVFGAGNADADIMLIGEGPGHEEDFQGKPFVGAAGQLLTKILAAINLTREEVYIANIVKCRPPQNRDPLPEEQEVCKEYLKKQIELIEPKFILALGRVAAQALLNTTKPMNQLRGTVYDWEGIKLIVTYHPAALLRNPQWKRATWEDVQVLQKLYREINGKF